LIFYHFIQKLIYKKVISLPFRVILVINRLFRLIRVILVIRINGSLLDQHAQWDFIVLDHINNSPLVDMSVHSGTLFWFRAKHSLFLLLGALCLRRSIKYQICSQVLSRLWVEPTIYRTLTIIPSVLRLCVFSLTIKPYNHLKQMGFWYVAIDYGCIVWSLLSFSIGTSFRSLHTKHSCVARALHFRLICIWLQTKMTQEIFWAAYIGHNANKAGKTLYSFLL
jgi:hypothetical protein